MKPTTRRPSTKPPRPLEADVQRAALQYLASVGVPAWRRNVGAFSGTHNGKRRFFRAGEPGQADIWGVLPVKNGRHLEIEVKRPGERPTLAQVQWLMALNDITGSAFWIDDFNDLKGIIGGLRTGGRVVYLNTTRRYGKVEGPSGDYKIVWDD